MITINLQELPPTTADAIKRALAGEEDLFITGEKEERLAQVVSVQKGNDQPSSKKVGPD